uniref:Uncharacterized protein n=1 Tax=Pyxicephalus adspersus TaxID=30357 RepID=A0AAV3A3U8_PYXAD|nr:TPA: hypothetical protein GDO54_016454 [Pyxicephalus adspersus]
MFLSKPKYSPWVNRIFWYLPSCCLGFTKYPGNSNYAHSVPKQPIPRPKLSNIGSRGMHCIHYSVQDILGKVDFTLRFLQGNNRK